MKSFIAVATSILLNELPHDGMFVDFTMTDGYDTLYMAEYMSEGNVVAFESDEAKMDNAYHLFESNFQDNAHIVLDNPLNVDKYVASDINGFSINAYKEKLSDDVTLKLIDKALAFTKVGGKGIVTMPRDMVKSIEHIEKMGESKVRVMAITMANLDVPVCYVMEKIA